MPLARLCHSYGVKARNGLQDCRSLDWIGRGTMIIKEIIP